MPEPTTEAAVPGTVVGAGVLISPGGDQGPIGQTGVQGIQGQQGIQGIQGVPGPAATCDAGTTTTGAPGSAAAVTNAGSTSAAVFNFTIPQGVVGPVGPAAYTVTTQDFVLPAVNLTATVTVQDASWVVPGQMVVVAGGYSLRCTAKAGNTLTLQNIGSPATAIPVVSPNGNGLMAMLPNTGQSYFRDDGSYVVLPGNYYGSDTTNAINFAVTVASDFLLNPGVVVWVTISNTSGANPTLNVNGTGAVPVRSRANIALFQSELAANRTFGVVYDGTVWRVITPLTRIFTIGNQAGALTIDCAGFDGVNAYVGCTGATALALTLAHVAQGIPLMVEIYNATAMAYTVAATTESGAAMTCYWCWASAVTGAAITNITTTGQTLTAGNHMLLMGANRLNSILFL
jgi:hypothetical protein